MKTPTIEVVKIDASKFKSFDEIMNTIIDNIQQTKDKINMSDAFDKMQKILIYILIKNINIIHMKI